MIGFQLISMQFYTTHRILFFHVFLAFAATVALFSCRRHDGPALVRLTAPPVPSKATWERIKIGRTTRTGFIVPASSSRLEFKVKVPYGKPHLFFSAGLQSDEKSKPHPVNFRISVVHKDSVTDIFQILNKHAGWKDVSIDLSRFAGKEVLLQLYTAAEAGNNQTAVWGSPEIYDISAAHKSPNIVLISVDTLRPDRLGAYGYGLPTSPAIDSLARRSLVFKNAFCTFPQTLPSHATVMTGLYAGKHKVAKPTLFLPRYGRIPQDLVTIAELASSRDYFTVGITDGGYVSSIYGFDDGFAEYSGNMNVVNRDPTANIDYAIQWLKKNHSRPFFLFLHTYRVHEPYEASINAFRRLFPNYPLKEESAVVETPQRWLNQLRRGVLVASAEDKQFVNHCYDAGILEFDWKFGNFLTELQRLNLQQNTVVLLFGDHGEQLFDRGNGLGHGTSLHREEIAVPFILYLPGKKHEQKNELVSLVDVYPTLAQIMGVNPIPATDGISVLDPQSQKKRAARCIYYEVIREDQASWGTQTHEFKLVFKFNTKEESLYDLRNDRQETRDVRFEFGRPMQVLKTSLSSYMKESMKPLQKSSKHQQLEETEELREQLRSLGYVN